VNDNTGLLRSLLQPFNTIFNTICIRLILFFYEMSNYFQVAVVALVAVEGVEGSLLSLLSKDTRAEMREKPFASCTEMTMGL